MKYVAPSYEKEILETTDIILASVQVSGGVTLTKIDENTAQAGVSALDILGLR